MIIFRYSRAKEQPSKYDKPNLKTTTLHSFKGFRPLVKATYSNKH